MVKKKSIKKWYKSKTLCVNVVMSLIMVAEMLLDTNWINPSILLFVTAVLNGILRIWFTTTQLK